MDEKSFNLPPAPAGVRNWIIKDVIEKTYIIYNKKKNEAVCTRCGHRFRADRFPIKHNEKGICPKCKSEATCKAEGIGRKNLTEYFRVLVLTHRGNTVYGSLTEITATFENVGKPELRGWLSAVYVFNKDEQSYYKHTPSWCWGTDHWEQIKAVKLPHPPSGMNWYSRPKFERTEVYKGNLKRTFLNSCLKYGWQPDMFQRNEFDAYDLISYINLHLKYQSIELLAKAGFECFVVEKVIGRIGSGCINWRGRSLEKILRLPRRHIKKLRGRYVNFQELSFFQNLTEKEKSFSWETITKAADAFKGDEARRIGKFISVVKWAEWARDQNVNKYDWLDYINDCRLLGMDTRKKSVLFPKDFATVHRRLSEQVEIQRTELENAAIKKVAEFQRMDSTRNGFILKIAESQEDLNVESSVLGHCVRTYGDKVAEGKTIIYFVRREEKPDEPYYTLEIKPEGKFIQCRGEHNCNMTPEVEAFKDLVVAEFNRRLKRKERKAA